MKRIVQQNFNGVDGLQIVEVTASKLTPLSVLVKNKYIPVLPYDWLTEYGLLKAIRPVKLPMVIGYGFGGIVEQVGMLRDKNLIGKKVIGMQPTGSAQEVINSQLPPLLFTVPDNVALSDAVTLIGGADAALHAINSVNVGPTDTVLVTGASGGVGVYLIQLLKLAGAKVIALASSGNSDFIKAVGADVVLDYTDALDMQLRHINAPNKIIDTVGRIDLLQIIATNYDELAIFSLSLTNFDPPKKQQTFQFSNGSIGISGYKRLLKLMADQQIVAYIQHKYKFTDVKKAHLASKNGHAQGRILLTF
ncbi:quinone oxidoreductase family protein [Loigolactobacillus jiayinensis]|uniref:Zinc-binding alcohol dehydrogenase family protein n=1 Tax=Loigolactobacillus jiayinensis TaxID=2486016 RepID=A0ABW1R8I6_9LACO|nr:zinc-binding dehydrogenase [Loigolactobacillus jiayinensis]